MVLLLCVTFAGATVTGHDWAGVAGMAARMAATLGAGRQLRAEPGLLPWFSSMWLLPVVWVSSSMVAGIQEVTF